jgi:hypothetical protein
MQRFGCIRKMEMEVMMVRGCGVLGCFLVDFLLCFNWRLVMILFTSREELKRKESWFGGDGESKMWEGYEGTQIGSKEEDQKSRCEKEMERWKRGQRW